MKQYIAIDIGGTAIKYGILLEDASFLLSEQLPTPTGGGPELTETVLSLIEEIRRKCESPTGVCISTAGMVDPEKGMIFHASDLIPHYTGTEWKRLVEGGCGLPCEVENDVNCAGLAEYTSGAARHSSSCLCMTIGTGIGGCLIINDGIWRGHTMSACEIGYLPMYGSTFETIGSAGALTRQVAARKNNPGLNWDGVRIFSEASRGDEDCMDAIDQVCEVLGRGIATICYVVNPETVVLGGGILAQHDILLPKIRSSVSKYLVDTIASRTHIVPATHGNQAGMLGAFYHFLQRHQP